MATTISGTTITYNDGSTTTTNTPNATAALAAGAIGSYAFCAYSPNVNTRAAGFTVAGSSLYYTSREGYNIAPGAGQPSGSWRLMGYLGSTSVPKGTAVAMASLWLRYA